MVCTVVLVHHTENNIYDLFILQQANSLITQQLESERKQAALVQDLQDTLTIRQNRLGGLTSRGQPEKKVRKSREAPIEMMCRR